MKMRERAKQLKSDIPAVFMALKDKDTPIVAKIFAGLAVGYALSPIDFVPILGYLDDVIILPILITLAIKFIPENVWLRSKEKSKELWKNENPKKWYYSIPMIVIWLSIICLIIKTIWF